jgi:hypothetical protein
VDVISGKSEYSTNENAKHHPQEQQGARELVTLISRHLDDHMEIAPDEVNWANAGSAEHLVAELKHIARFLNLINEEK